MRRHATDPRPDWQARVEAVGLSYHSHETGPYWDESACYEFEEAEITGLENAANTLHKLCIQAAEHVIEKGLWERLRIPEAARPLILDSWERDDFSLYGRFDLAFDGSGEPRLLEYNADTPTSLVEASVAQWFWLEECRPGMDQFNSLHERLIEAWKRRGPAARIHFASVGMHEEDAMNLLYLRDTCEQAGIPTQGMTMDNIGWDLRARRFVDLELRPIEHCFKLYPWEWLWQEDFARHLPGCSTRFLEPAWKMLLSNKGILPILWELFPDHPNLLPAFEDPAPLAGRDRVRKPLLGREGGNVQLHRGDALVAETEGAYGDEGYIWQQEARLPDFDGNHPVLGVWIVDHEAAGLGIREDRSPITGNLSRFIPHFFRPA
jgi:glutathionylspermidine synthase